MLENPPNEQELQNKVDELEELKGVQDKSNSILDRELTSPLGEKKKIADVLEKDDVYTIGDKVIFKHVAILRMIEFVDAEPLDPQPINGFLNKDSSGYVFYCPIKFPNGEISRWGMGEANEQNTESFGKSYKANQAIIRGFARSFLHSKTVGLYDVYSEGEAADFNKQTVHIDELNRRIAMLEKQITNLKGKNKNISVSNEEMNVKFNLAKDIALLPSAQELVLPSNDKKYPNESIVSVLNEFKDGPYARELMETLPEGHPIKVLLIFLREKAEIDKKNNKRYNLYSRALELLSELRSPKEQAVTKTDNKQDNTVSSFIDSINQETNPKNSINEIPIKEELSEDSPEDTIDTPSITKKMEETIHTQEKTPVQKDTNSSFFDELDQIINLEELAEVKHLPTNDEENKKKNEEPKNNGRTVKLKEENPNDDKPKEKKKRGRPRKKKDENE